MRELIAVVASICVVGFATGMTIPFVSLKLTATGASPTLIGLLSAAPALGTLLIAPFVTKLSERYSLRNLLVFSTLLSALSVALLASPPNNIVWLLLRLLMGATCGILVILGESWVNKLASFQYRGRLIAIYTTAFTICQVAGPAVLSLLGSESQIPIIIIVVCHLLAAYTLFIGCISSTEIFSEKNFGILSFLVKAPSIAIAIALFAFFDAAILSLMPIYGMYYGSVESIALLMVTFIFVGDAALQIPIGWLSDKVGRIRVHLLCGLIVFIFALCMPLFMRAGVWIWPALMIFGAAAGGIYTIGLVRIGDHFRGYDLITANASVGLLWGIGGLLGPTVGGLAIDYLSPSGLMSSLAIFTVLFLFVLMRDIKGGKQRPSNAIISEPTRPE